MACTYILYSDILKKNYIGACQAKLEDRVSAHNSGKYGSHRFTAAANDWKLVLRLECDDYNHALRLEKKIKRMKSSKYINNLILFEEMRKRIIEETKSI
jgi:putative endonuclease